MKLPVKKPRDLLWMLPLLFLVGMPIWKPPVAAFLKPRGDFATIDPLAEKQEQNFIMDSITLTLTSQGKQEWVVRAQRAFTGKTDREIGMIGVNALYTGKKQRPTRITANRGTYLMDDRHLILIENVVIFKPDTHERLNTELLHYYDATKMAVSPVDVDIVAPSFSLHAGRMDYDLSTDGYDFSNGVKVTL